MYSIKQTKPSELEKLIIKKFVRISAFYKAFKYIFINIEKLNLKIFLNWTQ